MNGVIEQAERNKCILVFVFNSLCGLLKAGKHRTFAAGKMLSGITVFTNLGENILHQSELIRNKRICLNKVIFTGIPLEIQHSVIESKEVLQYGTVFAITHKKHLLSRFSLGKNTLFDNFINRRRRQAQTGIKTSLNL